MPPCASVQDGTIFIFLQFVVFVVLVVFLFVIFVVLVVLIVILIIVLLVFHFYISLSAIQFVSQGYY